MSSEEEEESMHDKDMVGGCCVCSEQNGYNENPLVYCDGQQCTVAVHQACYGIVTIPPGEWYCRKCESPEAVDRVKCELCPTREGALKRTDKGGWAHVVCALYIPEVRFGDTTTMEPILTTLIPQERYGRTCCICKFKDGAVMPCNRPHCSKVFHVTCAQMRGWLCEESSNPDNVKYCGYCDYHYTKLKSTKNVKMIPPFHPPEKQGCRPSSSSIEDKPSSSSGSNNSGSRHSITATDYTPAKKSGSNSSISPDIDSSTSSRSSKYSKKSGNGSHSHSSSSSKSSENGSLSKSSSSSSIMPKIAQPVLNTSSFSSGIGSSRDSETLEENKSDSTTVGTHSRKNSDSSRDDSYKIKLEVPSLHLKEVVTAALDRSSSGNGGRYDPATSSSHTSSASGELTSSGSHPTSHISSNQSSSGASKHSEKPALPDIKPHVTLTPIPMKGVNVAPSTINLARSDREEREEKEGRSKSPGSSSVSFHSSTSTLGQQKAQDSAETCSVAKASSKHHADISPIEHMDKSAPPAKRPRGGSRDDDNRGRKTPTKGRGGGRRGNSNSGYHSKRDLGDDSNYDESLLESGGTSSRGSRSGGHGKKSAAASSSSSRRIEDPPAPTLSQLRMETAETFGPLPTHMFGNALNPASSMAQRMVDTLSQEMEAVAAAGASSVPESSSSTAAVGIPLPGKSSTTVNGGGGSGSTATGNNSSAAAAPPQTLEQLLERQWEQGSQFLMEQAQHLDIAQLLSCLNQLKQDNRALEEHLQSLVQRRDQLTAINARLSIPLGSSSALGSLGPTFNNGINGTSQNGHGTPPPSLTPQAMPPTPTPHPMVPKNLRVNSSTPSPQNQHELLMQNARHAPRDERGAYHSHSELQASRQEMNMHHQHQHGTAHYPHSRQNVAPYGFSGVPHHSGSGPHHQHGHGRDGGGR